MSRKAIFLVIAMLCTLGLGLPLQADDGELLTLRAYPTFVQPANRIVWTVTLRNPTERTLEDVIVDILYPPHVELIGAQTIDGMAQIHPNAITWSVPALAPQDNYELLIESHPNADYTDNTITVTARLTSTQHELNQIIQSQAYVVTGLPATGESPAWRIPLFFLVIFGVILIVATNIVGATTKR